MCWPAATAAGGDDRPEGLSLAWNWCLLMGCFSCWPASSSGASPRSCPSGVTMGLCLRPGAAIYPKQLQCGGSCNLTINTDRFIRSCWRNLRVENLARGLCGTAGLLVLWLESVARACARAWWAGGCGCWACCGSIGLRLMAWRLARHDRTWPGAGAIWPGAAICDCCAWASAFALGLILFAEFLGSIRSFGSRMATCVVHSPGPVALALQPRFRGVPRMRRCRDLATSANAALALIHAWGGGSSRRGEPIVIVYVVPYVALTPEPVWRHVVLCVGRCLS